MRVGIIQLIQFARWCGSLARFQRNSAVHLFLHARNFASCHAKSWLFAGLPFPVESCIFGVWFVKLYESCAWEPWLTVYCALQVEILVGFLQVLAMCQFVLGEAVLRASLHACACVGNSQTLQKSHCKTLQLAHGRACATNIW